MNSKYHADTRKIDGVPLEIIVTNPKRNSKHKMPCRMPMDSIDMDLPTFSKAYGPHIIQAVHELLQHKSFKQGLKSSLIIAPDEAAAESILDV